MWLLEAACAMKAGKPNKAPNKGFFFNGEPKYVTSQVIWINLLIIYVFPYYVITQRPRDRLFQKFGIWSQHVQRKLENKKSAKFEFLFT